MSREEAVARTLEDMGETLKIVLDFLGSDSEHLKDMGVQKKVAEFPWDARDSAITEMMFTMEGLRNRIRLIEGR
jgi:hypothetical protein